MEAAISKLRNGKAPDACGIRAGLLLAKNLVVVKWLHKITSIVWSMREVPENWRAVIIPLHKKGSRTECSNYPGIILLSVPVEVYARIVDYRVKQRQKERYWKCREASGSDGVALNRYLQ